MKAAIFLFVLAVASAKPLDKFLEYAKKFPNTNEFPDPEYSLDLFEGDIIVNSEEEAESLKQGNPLNALPDRNKRWEDNTLYYFINEEDFDSDQVQKIQAGINDLQESVKVNGNECIRLVPYTDQENFVFVRTGGGCSSSLGRVGGVQYLTLADGCIRAHGTIMHEFLHALGFHHEQKRADRDDFVTINYDNINPRAVHNFDKLVEGVSVDHLGTRYDYGSVMHYGAYGFAIDRNIPTIIPLDPNAEIGQRIQLSAADIERVQIYYECKTAAESTYFKHLA